MAEVIGDPDEIEAFAQELAVYCEYARENLGRIAGRLDRMENERAWADDVYRDYREMFDEARNSLQRTLDTVSADHVQHLRGVVERLREYLHTRRLA
jgi:hypothetical protein